MINIGEICGWSRPNSRRVHKESHGSPRLPLLPTGRISRAAPQDPSGRSSEGTPRSALWVLRVNQHFFHRCQVHNPDFATGFCRPGDSPALSTSAAQTHGRESSALETCSRSHRTWPSSLHYETDFPNPTIYVTVDAGLTIRSRQPAILEKFGRTATGPRRVT